MKRTLISAAAVLACLADGCFSADPAPATQPETPAILSTANSPATTAVAEAPEETLYGVTPDGLTTAVNAPVDESSPEDAQGCSDAEQLIATIGPDAELILAFIQATPDDSTDSLTVEDSGDDLWGTATPEERALIVATVNAAVEGTCPS